MTSSTTTARGPSGATWWPSRSRRTSDLRVHALQEVRQDPGGRAPDHVLTDLVGRGPDRDPAPDQPAHREAVAQLIQGEHQDRGYLARVRPEAQAVRDGPDE